jgi:hypothetical protein
VAEGDGVVVGVDTHADIHVGGCPVEPWRTAWIEARGHDPDRVRRTGGLGEGVREDPVFRCGGNRSHGAALARHLRAVGHTVVEVDRPDRRTRRLQGKSDPVDAESAARAVLAGTASGCPKAGDGRVEMIRSLRVARRSPLKARTQAIFTGVDSSSLIKYTTANTARRRSGRSDSYGTR